MAFDKPFVTVTIACEASNQPHSARVGVAETILNRSKDPRYGRSPAAECLRRFQFSEWNGDAIDNANVERVLRMSDSDPVIVDCAAAWDEAVAGSNLTGGATHFFSDGIPEPVWAQDATFTAKLGALNFFRNVP
jgi:spore germination cell wall hydrolase CwlJ-like protein